VTGRERDARAPAPRDGPPGGPRGAAKGARRPPPPPLPPEAQALVGRLLGRIRKARPAARRGCARMALRMPGRSARPGRGIREAGAPCKLPRVQRRSVVGRATRQPMCRRAAVAAASRCQLCDAHQGDHSMLKIALLPPSAAVPGRARRR